VVDDAAPEFVPDFGQNELGIGNRLHLLDEELLKNLNEIQLRNGLRPSSSLASGDFTVANDYGTFADKISTSSQRPADKR